MDKCADPIQYLQDALHERIQAIIAENRAGNIIKSSTSVSLACLGLQVDRRSGDLFVPAFSRRLKSMIKEPTEIDPSHVIQELLKGAPLEVYTKECKSVSTDHLLMILNRAAVTNDVIRNVITRKHKYGNGNKLCSLESDEPLPRMCREMSDQKVHLVISDTVLLDCAEVCDIDLSQLRMAITGMHINKLLLESGMQVDAMHQMPVQQDLQSRLMDRLELLSLFNDSYASAESHSEMDTCSKAIQDVKDLLKSCRYTRNTNHTNSPEGFHSTRTDVPYLQCSEDQSIDDSNRTGSSQLCALQVLDIGQYLKDQGKLSGFDKSIQESKVVMSRQLVDHLSSLELHAKRIQHKGSYQQVVHLTSCRKLFVRQKEGLAWHMISGNTLATSQVYISHGLVSVHNSGQKIDQNIGLQDLLRIREGQLRSAYHLKYGDIVQGAGWNDSIRAMAIATIKIQLLAAALHSTIKLDICDTSPDFRRATFVMYNCARLSKLFQRYERSVQQGLYPPLPPIDEVNFTLLRDEDEWSLLLRYVMTYPSVILDSIQGLKNPKQGSTVTLHTSRVCCFLLAISHDFSSYYGRVHILGEPRRHLFPTMFARLYLMKAIQQVMHNCLALLEIQPLTQM